MKTKHAVHMIALGVITNNEDIMPQFIFSHSLMLNTEAYIKYL